MQRCGVGATQAWQLRQGREGGQFGCRPPAHKLLQGVHRGGGLAGLRLRARSLRHRRVVGSEAHAGTLPLGEREGHPVAEVVEGKAVALLQEAHGLRVQLHPVGWDGLHSHGHKLRLDRCRCLTERKLHCDAWHPELILHDSHIHMKLDGSSFVMLLEPIPLRFQVDHLLLWRCHCHESRPPRINRTKTTGIKTACLCLVASRDQEATL
mmetsp:Transcript_101339/g.282049  ORF Transcript_101339/g.282049 Transcript_101339/m.282049 type:complete len:209 (+) Transcript_101339:1044-1670(+)